MQGSLYNCHRLLENLPVLWDQQGKVDQTDPWVFPSFSDSDSSLQRSKGSFWYKDKSLIQYPVGFSLNPAQGLQAWNLWGADHVALLRQMGEQPAFCTLYLLLLGSDSLQEHIKEEKIQQ